MYYHMLRLTPWALEYKRGCFPSYVMSVVLVLLWCSLRGFLCAALCYLPVQVLCLESSPRKTFTKVDLLLG
jgi:hypothetical protein